MKKFLFDFLHRGLVACGLGPIVLAVVYLALQQAGAIENLTVYQVCVGIFSLTALAFVAGGMNAIYQIERLPLMIAILIHGSVLYVGYLVTYIVNNWLEWGVIPIFVFTGIFAFGFLLIWAIIYFIIKRNTTKINAALQKRQHNAEDMAN